MKKIKTASRLNQKVQKAEASITFFLVQTEIKLFQKDDVGKKNQREEKTITAMK